MARTATLVPLDQRATERADLIARLVRLADHEPEQTWGPSRITDPEVGDLAVIVRQNRPRWAVVTKVNAKTGNVTVSWMTKAGIESKRRGMSYFGDARVPGYAEQRAQAAADNVRRLHASLAPWAEADLLDTVDDQRARALFAKLDGERSPMADPLSVDPKGAAANRIVNARQERKKLGTPEQTFQKTFELATIEAAIATTVTPEWWACWAPVINTTVSPDDVMIVRD